MTSDDEIQAAWRNLVQAAIVAEQARVWKLLREASDGRGLINREYAMSVARDGVQRIVARLEDVYERVFFAACPLAERAAALEIARAEFAMIAARAMAALGDERITYH